MTVVVGVPIAHEQNGDDRYYQSIAEPYIAHFLNSFQHENFWFI
jgi:hypothetical protein